MARPLARQLRRLGLSKGEVAVYTQLLATGPATVSDVGKTLDSDEDQIRQEVDGLSRLGLVGHSGDDAAAITPISPIAALAPRLAGVLLYNRGWAQELGFNRAPTTPGEFKEQACAAAQALLADDEFDNNGTGGYLVDGDPLVVSSWILAFGGSLSGSDSPDSYFDPEPVEEAFSYLKGLFDRGCAWIGRRVTVSMARGRPPGSVRNAAVTLQQVRNCLTTLPVLDPVVECLVHSLARGADPAMALQVLPDPVVLLQRECRFSVQRVEVRRAAEAVLRRGIGPHLQDELHEFRVPRLDRAVQARFRLLGAHGVGDPGKWQGLRLQRAERLRGQMTRVRTASACGIALALVAANAAAQCAMSGAGMRSTIVPRSLAHTIRRSRSTRAA